MRLLGVAVAMVAVITGAIYGVYAWLAGESAAPEMTMDEFLGLFDE